jgi:L-asparaginase
VKTKILIIYTGGTIGMVMDNRTNALVPFDFEHLYKQVPELEKFDLELSVNSFDQPIDSSDMSINAWQKMATIIKENYHLYDGFVILHGSDTMAYTASALSFMLENLAKPVILTGSQLPIGMIRTDGKENLITAIEIAGAKINGLPIINEVAIYFEYKLLRGNRTHKYNAEHFDAFKSPNFPVLAEAGIKIDYNFTSLLSKPKEELVVRLNMDGNIGVLKLFPGITPAVVQSVLHSKGLKALIIETFGSGNGPTQEWFVKEIEEAIKSRNLTILNVTQCNQGAVNQGRYATSKGLLKAGVIGGNDITFEAAITKLMYLFGNLNNKPDIERYLQSNMRGEITLN